VNAPSQAGLLLVVLACGLDRWVGDPPRWLHPVVVMGWCISRLRRLGESWAGDRPWRLRTAGLLIALLLVGGSGGGGWLLEQVAWRSLGNGFGQLGGSAGFGGSGDPMPLLAGIGASLGVVIGLASALAGRSLEQAVLAVAAALEAGDLPLARRRLAGIVGRDTRDLDATGILRAAAETASENAVDGQFAPLFWMVVGAALWGLSDRLPGPLALAWAFKAASTLDSMLGYRRGRLRWLGTAGARLDDLLVWLPCRLVVLTLPLLCVGPAHWWGRVRASLRDGAPDPSPNAGVSQAAFAHAAGVELGGWNRYSEGWREKPRLATGQGAPDRAAVETILKLSRRLTLVWLAMAGAGALVLAG
jgi:adenosylcobinamide-phosphate synthase